MSLEEPEVKQAWQFANNAKERLSRNDNIDFREQIAETARKCGFKDIWVFVFMNDKDMLMRLDTVEKEYI